MKTELKKLVIEVGGKKLEFTPAEAKELKNILADLFGADKTTHVHHYDPYRWSWPCYAGTTTLYGSISNGSATSTAWTGYSNTAGTCTLTASGV